MKNCGLTVAKLWQLQCYQLCIDIRAVHLLINTINLRFYDTACKTMDFCTETDADAGSALAALFLQCLFLVTSFVTAFMFW